MSNKKRILLIACGGTIACTDDGDGGAKQSLTGEQLVSNISELADLADIDTLQFRQINSSSITFLDVVELANLIQSKNYDGYVITHGTDSIEETAFALDLMYSGAEPIVITGAMRHSSLHSADGNSNILASMVTVTNDNSIGYGVMVVLNDTVHAARFVTKSHTSRPDAFISKPGGILGWLSENRLIMVAKVTRSPAFADSFKQAITLTNHNNIPIIKSYSGDDGSLLKLISESNHYTAIVIEALGGGHVSETMAKEIELAAKNMTIVVSSRTGQGSTLTSTYGAIGSEIDLINKGVLMAGWLNTIQARILLQLLLAGNLNTKQIKKKFEDYCLAK